MKVVAISDLHCGSKAGLAHPTDAMWLMQYYRNQAYRVARVLAKHIKLKEGRHGNQ